MAGSLAAFCILYKPVSSNLVISNSQRTVSLLLANYLFFRLYELVHYYQLNTQYVIVNAIIMPVLEKSGRFDNKLL